MRRISGLIFAVLMSLSLNLHGESDGYNQWTERRDSLKKDPSVARYYTFEDVKDSKSIVKDLGANGANLTFIPYTDTATKKIYDDLQVVEGRWPGKKAVRLNLGYYQGPNYEIENKRFTAEVWFRRIGPGSEPLSRVNQRRGHLISLQGHRRGWRIYTSYDIPVSVEMITSASVITFQLGKSESEKASSAVSAKTLMTDNIWQHIAVSWDGKEMRMYLNGQLMGSTEYDRDYIPVSAARPNSFRLGFAGLGLGAVVTDIDEVVIYNRVLTAEEITKLSKGTSEVSREEALARGDSFLARGDFGNARKEYEKLKMLPDYGRELALFNIAESYRLEKKFANVHKVFAEISAIPGLKPYYRIHSMFKQAEAYIEQKDYQNARQLYELISKTEGASDYHVFTAKLKTGDSFRQQRKYSEARKLYHGLLREEESGSFPNDGNRLELSDRLEAIDGLNDGEVEKSITEEIAEWLNSPGQSIYVSPKGNDSNTGTKEKPFATLKKAREEANRIKRKGGVTIYLREGSYFLSEPLTFTREDSGTEDYPVVFRSYPGEEARIIGGAPVNDFSPLSDQSVLGKLPEEARGKVWVADLKKTGITDYGQLANRVDSSNPAAMELIYNGRIMQLSRWPNDTWLRVAALVNPAGEYKFRNVPYEKGRFIYSGDRPERWKEEKEIWLKGYMGVETPFLLKFLRVDSIDSGKKIIYVREDPKQRKKDPHYEGNRIAAKHPYFAYNLLSEIDMPGEWYLDRETGKLYFYPPGRIESGQVVVTMIDEPLVQFTDASNIAFFGLTVEGGRSHAFQIEGGRNNIIAASVIRNTGQYAVRIGSGWEHKVVGCNIHDTGQGGITLDGGDRVKLIPARHLLENNHIHRFGSRFSGGGPAVSVNGTGQRIAHNLIHDGPLQMLYFNANDHVIEYNELHDGPHEGREIGAVYIYGADWFLMNRGTVIRNNFFHHISSHSSPNLTHGLNAIHIDAVNAGIVLKENIFYRFPQGISSTQPGNYITNNLFIDGSSNAIGQGDRSDLLCKNVDINAGPNLERMRAISEKMKSMHYKQPPWNYRYPPLLNMLESEPAVWGKMQGSIIERNVNTGGRFISFGQGTLATTRFKDNWDGENPLFMDMENMDFRLRPGSHVYGLTGCGEITNKAGVYKDALRVSWPIDRKKEDIGKYYKPGYSAIGEVKMTMGTIPRVSPPLEYAVAPRKTEIVVDGKLGEKEWPGMQKDSFLLIERKGPAGKKGIKSYAWLLYDSRYLYVATKHEPDPYTEAMTETQKNHFPAFELSIETQAGPHSKGWWMDDMPTGPIYIMWGYFSGKFQVMNNFKMPFKNLKSLEDSIEYKVSVINEETREWTSEMKIPLASIGINPAEIDKLCFNMGVWKRDDWVVWVPTGGSVWRIENAGFIRFLK